MNFEEAMQKLVQFSVEEKIPREKIVVGGSLAAYLQGVDLRRPIGDIDVEIEDIRMFRTLEIKYGSRWETMPDEKYGQRQFLIVGVHGVDAHLPAGLPVCEIEGFKVWTLETLYAFKRESAREKDVQDVQRIREYWSQTRHPD